jgi:hypothetical protein
MPSIVWNGDTYHGISVFGRGVFTDDKLGGRTYAGQMRDGHACGLGVTTWSNGYKVFAEHGPEGQYDGWCLGRSAYGTFYRLFERSKQKDSAFVSADGRYCNYNFVVCARDDPRLLALIALVAPVEVRPAAPASHPPLAPKQSSDGSAGSFCPRRRWRPPWPPRCTPHSARRRWWLRDRTQQQSHCKATLARTDLRNWSQGRRVPSFALTTAAWCTPMGPSRPRRCHAIVQHTAC